MGFHLSHRGARRNSGGDGGDGTVIKPFPLPDGIGVDSGTVAPLPTDYQVPHLIYIVFRNGVEQEPFRDFTTNATTLTFNQPFTTGERVRFYAYGFSL